MSILYKFNKAEYIFKPSQLLKRLTGSGMERTDSIMPWGLSLHYNPKEDIGKAINVLGIYELPLTELIFRSLGHVDHFVDVGANIGYFTSLASSFTNIETINSFEPHPFIFEILKRNSKDSKIKLNAFAASDKNGIAELYIPKDFNENMGIASLEKPEEEEIEKIEIETKPLDEILNSDQNYCLKIDTEGHESSVLLGAKELLKKQAFSYIFFEEFESYPQAESFKILHDNNYEITRIERGLMGPKLDDPNTNREIKRWQPVNFLAVPKGSENLERISGLGWNILKL